MKGKIDERGFLWGETMSEKPDWIGLLVEHCGCPDTSCDESCGNASMISEDAQRRCWERVIKDRYGWEPAEVS